MMPDRNLRRQIDELVSEISKEPENIRQLYVALQEKRAQISAQVGWQH
jgi:hypothetical protein